MTSHEILILTALLVVTLVALALLVSGIGLMLNVWHNTGTNSDETTKRSRASRWRIERLVYRHHRIAGSLIALGSALFLSQGLRAPSIEPWSQSVVLTTFWWGLLAAHACILLIGLVILLRPSRLKAIESLANRHYDLGFRLVTRPHNDRPRLQGLLLVFIAAVVLAGMGILLMERLDLLG
jgi:hypothetical protein